MIPDDVRLALQAYRRDRTSARWTELSQMWIGQLQVIDALQRIDPEFPVDLPLPVDGVIEDNAELFEWKTLPDPDDVERALAAYASAGLDAAPQPNGNRLAASIVGTAGGSERGSQSPP